MVWYGMVWYGMVWYGETEDLYRNLLRTINRRDPEFNVIW